MSQESDDLLEYIAQIVRGRVPPEHERLVVELVARTLTMMMNTPDFVNRLLIVQQLTYTVQQLQQENLLLQQTLLTQLPRKRPPATKKKAVKMGPVKVVPKKKAPKGASTAFKKGAAGL